MKMFFSLLIGLFFLFSTILASNVHAQRYAVCDVCGFCVSPVPGGSPTYDKVPDNWEACRKCLYEAASTNPDNFDTLKIDVTTNTGPTPQPGRHFTLLGCISTTQSDYTQIGAAGSATQTILNVIFSTSGGIAFLYLIYGSFIVTTSRANPEKLNQGKQIIVGAVVGLIFVISSVFLVNLIASGILKIPGFE